jgi:hypothetical protein
MTTAISKPTRSSDNERGTIRIDRVRMTGLLTIGQRGDILDGGRGWSNTGLRPGSRTARLGRVSLRRLGRRPVRREGFGKLGPIIFRDDIKQLIVEGNSAFVLTDTEVGPVLTSEFLTVEEGRIRSITLLFDWRRWPEVLQELGRRSTQPVIHALMARPPSGWLIVPP